MWEFSARAEGGAVSPRLQVRPALLRKTLMQTQIVTHTQHQAQACLPGIWFDLLVGLKQLESGRDDLDLGSRDLECQPVHRPSLANVTGLSLRLLRAGQQIVTGSGRFYAT